MKISQLSYVLLSVSLVLLLAGCSGANSGGKSSAPSASADPAAGEKKTPVTFTYFNAAVAGKDANTNETVLGKLLEDQTGVNFKMEYLVGDLNTKLGVMIAGGDLPDVVVPDSGIDKMLDAKAFIPLNDLLDQYAPNLKKLYGPYWDQMASEDGNIYVIPFAASNGFVPDMYQPGAFYIQQGVLKEFGYPKIQTLDEYFDLIKKYKEKYPQIDGGDTIGFETLTDDWRFFTLTNPAPNLNGLPNEGEVFVDMETKKAAVTGDKDFMKRWLQKLNEANSEGLLDKESLVAKYDQYIAKLSSGRVLGFFDYGWQIVPAVQNLVQAGNDDRNFIGFPLVFEKGTKDQYLDPPTFVTNRGIGITTRAKDPARIIQYFDNMVKEENQKLLFWGEQGKTYEVDDKGRFYRTEEQIAQIQNPEFQQSYGFSYFSYYWPMGAGLFEDGNAYFPDRQPEVVEKSYTEGDKRILEAYGLKVFTDVYSPPDERKWYPVWSANKQQGSKEQLFEQKKMDLQRKWFPKLILAAPDKFDAMWGDYVADFNKLDVKAYEDWANSVVQDRLAGKKR
ncbi:ABC transporter substrate-binding protein [Paenibacillus radicis (ex Gao et al. 2016)]|uniref:ABC transporter substrate-binding protein n=1 Tax=Paenibacillus radicis (ex Gao et al. 2016) TaxID=1737354 RepID=A0A917GXP3_9BACL|nr:ABC transporter substrate-binding protein [Paenibacillus radicis (ex Gao et al. 2016)]GGG60743.1 ABC transporter substrate-binding protein [Paenibacillus radicis (ex Gao et al. 2016)]